ncbi:hypothetical protein WG66_011582, partial [Moniliophthora roreri]
MDNPLPRVVFYAPETIISASLKSMRSTLRARSSSGDALPEAVYYTIKVFARNTLLIGALLFHEVAGFRLELSPTAYNSDGGYAGLTDGESSSIEKLETVGMIPEWKRMSRHRSIRFSVPMWSIYTCGMGLSLAEWLGISNDSELALSHRSELTFQVTA